MQKSLKTTIAIICTPLILLFAHRVKTPQLRGVFITFYYKLNNYLFLIIFDLKFL